MYLREAIPTIVPLSPLKQTALFVLSLLIVAFGQPAWSAVCSLIAASVGYALFWRLLLDMTSAKRRFWLSTLWFASVQLVQLSWLLSHPFYYIYGLWLLVSFLWGLQFGVIGILIQPPVFQNWKKWLLIPALWTLFEWVRLFILSGFPFNPSGLALTSFLYPLQTASVWGIFGLSFLVMLNNCLAIKAWISSPYIPLWLAVLTLPFLLGAFHFHYHDKQFAEHEAKTQEPYHALLVQTAFPVEESMNIQSKHEFIAYVLMEWRQILTITQKHYGKAIDLIAYPEFVVPLATYTPVFPHDQVVKSFEEIVGKDSLSHLPPLEPPFAQEFHTSKGKVWMVSNAYWLQAIANVFGSDVIAGLEDVERIADNRHEFYSSAIYFQSKNENAPTNFQRYEKQVLVPMGEYIPFTFLKEMAASYGISGSFTCGSGAKLFDQNRIPFGVSICYEETYGHLMSENKNKGAQMLVNLTSDIWYPNSKLIQQHFDHARLRTVEMGIPLVRACNTGLTCGVDSLGRVVDVLGKTPQEQEWSAEGLYLKVPTYTYNTLYSKWGDWFIVFVSGFLMMLGIVFYRKEDNGTHPKTH